jgi:carboxymethylenebutenolidase
MTSIRDRVVELYDAYTHEHRDRRQLLREVTALVGSVAAAEVLIAGIGASPAAAAIVPPDDKRLRTATRTSEEAGKPLTVYTATPVKGARRGRVVVVHENRGLNDHIRDVARRMALAGFDTVAPDLLSPVGGTPVGDDDRARALIGTVDYDLAIAQVRALLKAGRGKAGVVGFCWGGAMVNRVAVAAGRDLAAGVSYYGPAPAASEAAKVQAPLMIHLAGKDARVNATAEPWIAALKAAGKTVEAFTYADVDHAFNNDTSAERYNKAAADLAWERTTGFFAKYLA